MIGDPVSGMARCPYDPKHANVALFAGKTHTRHLSPQQCLDHAEPLNFNKQLKNLTVLPRKETFVPLTLSTPESPVKGAHDIVEQESENLPGLKRLRSYKSSTELYSVLSTHLLHMCMLG